MNAHASVSQQPQSAGDLRGFTLAFCSPPHGPIHTVFRVMTFSHAMATRNFRSSASRVPTLQFFFGTNTKAVRYQCSQARTIRT